MRITGFLVMDGKGDKIQADAHGNNLAFLCAECGHPILAVALENQRGSDEKPAAAYKGCDARYFLDVRSHEEKLYVHSLSRKYS